MEAALVSVHAGVPALDPRARAGGAARGTSGEPLSLARSLARARRAAKKKKQPLDAVAHVLDRRPRRVERVASTSKTGLPPADAVERALRTTCGAHGFRSRRDRGGGVASSVS